MCWGWWANGPSPVEEPSHEQQVPVPDFLSTAVSTVRMEGQSQMRQDGHGVTDAHQRHIKLSPQSTCL